MIDTTTRKFGPVAAEAKPFRTYGSVRGTDTPLDEIYGELPKQWHDSFDQADYAVMSYATPVGWRLPGGLWVVPEVKYSVTTTRTQHLLLAALDAAGETVHTP